jgi:hypothetical protein
MTTSDARPLEVGAIPQPIIEYLRNVEGSAPPTLESHGQTWSLITAVEKVLTQSDLSQPIPNVESEVQLSPVNVILRSIKATDLTFRQDRVVRYAEVSRVNQVG